MNLQPIQDILQKFIDTEGGTFGILVNLLEMVLIIALLLLCQQVMVRLVNQRVEDVQQRHQVRVWIRTLVFVLMFLAIVVLWFPSGSLFIQVLALLAATLTLTLSRPISSLLAWGVIIVRTPFRIGDRIQLKGVRGDVVDINLLHIHLLEIGNWVDADQSTGRLIHLPNSAIFEEPIFNYTEAFDLVWNELEFVITHESDWERAREIILAQAQSSYHQIEQRAVEAAERMGERYAYRRGITTPFVYIKLLRDGIKLSLRYLCEPRRRRGTSHDITVGFLKAIRSEPKIRLAAPSYRVVMTNEE